MHKSHLYPVSGISPSLSPTASTIPPGDHSPYHKESSALRPSPSPAAPLVRRRPMSPSSLRELDLSHTTDMPPRKYPAPPTAHELMTMFPTLPPDNFKMRPGPTCDLFKHQERAFFAQAGKEMVRVRVKVDFPHEIESEAVKPGPVSWPWPSNGPGPGPSPYTTLPHHSPTQSSSTSLPYPHPETRPAPRVFVLANLTPMFPHPSHTPTFDQLLPNLHPLVLHQTMSGLQTPPEDTAPPNSKPKCAPEDHDPNEAWRRSMPYAECRRAEKHTRCVIART